MTTEEKQPAPPLPILVGRPNRTVEEWRGRVGLGVTLSGIAGFCFSNVYGHQLYMQDNPVAESFSVMTGILCMVAFFGGGVLGLTSLGTREGKASLAIGVLPTLFLMANLFLLLSER